MSAAAPEGQPAGSQLLRSGASLAVATMIAGVLGYVYILVLTRSLGPEQYGILGSLLGLSVVLSVASTALQLEAMRAVASDPSAPRDWLRRRGRIISIATGAVTLAAGPVIVEVLRLPTWAPALALAALMVPQTYIGVQLGILLGAGRTGAFSLLLVLSGLSRTLAAILTAALKESPTFALWASAATGVAVLLLGALLVRAAEPPRHTSAEVATPRDWSGVWRAAVDAGALVVLLNADLLAARAVLPDRESGWYAFLTVFGRVTFWGTNFIALWVFPHEAARGSAAQARAYALGAVAGIAGFAFVAAVVGGRAITAALAGPEYADAAHFAPWFAIAGSLLSVVQLATYVDVARARQVLSLIVWTGSLVLVVAIRWLAPHTIAGAIWTTIIVLGVVALAGILSMRERSSAT